MKLVYLGAMAIGSVVMWIGAPLGLVWLASQVTDSTQPSMGPYLIVIFGLPIAMTAIGKALGALDRSYARRFHGGERRYRPPWQRSMRGGREEGHQWTRLDLVMLYSVLVALVLSGIWFLFFAGSPLPSA